MFAVLLFVINMQTSIKQYSAYVKSKNSFLKSLHEAISKGKEFRNLIADGKMNIYMNHSCIGDVENGVHAHECDSLAGLKLSEGIVIKLFKILKVKLSFKYDLLVSRDGQPREYSKLVTLVFLLYLLQTK